MKQKDFAVIGVIVVVSAIISYVFASKVIVGPSSRNAQVPTVQALNSQFTPPSNKYFNNQAIDPTQLITITNNSSQAPFNGS